MRILQESIIESSKTKELHKHVENIVLKIIECLKNKNKIILFGKVEMQ